MARSNTKLSNGSSKGISNEPSAQYSPTQGFTIVELLIVIVIIAILAVITLVAYNGITTQAIETTMKSDLKNASTAVELYKVSNSDTYPSNLSAVNNGQGFKASGSNTLTYFVIGSDYCMSVANSQSSSTFHLKNADTTPASGDCNVSGTASIFATGALYGYYGSSYGLAVDGSGNLYSTATGSNRIIKITSTGVVTTLAGSGTAGYVDGTGTAAQFNKPYGIAVDSSGNIYVADYGNNRIRKITSTGVVTTLAGSGTAGYVDGTGTAAQFNKPNGITVDSSGNVYVTSFGDAAVRKVTSTGVVTTLAGSGTFAYSDGVGTSAHFNRPLGLSIDSFGNVYVAEDVDNDIRKITSDGVVTTLAGSGAPKHTDGTGESAQFYNPFGVAVDISGVIYTTGIYDGVRRITPSGAVTTLVDEGTAASSYSIAVDNSGNVYLSSPPTIYKIVQQIQ